MLKQQVKLMGEYTLIISEHAYYPHSQLAADLCVKAKPGGFVFHQTFQFDISKHPPVANGTLLNCTD